MSLPAFQRWTSHADTSASVKIDQTQPIRHIPSKQMGESATTDARVLLAKAGKRTTFISKPPRQRSLGTHQAASYQVKSA
jgi:hypothetical protein